MNVLLVSANREQLPSLVMPLGLLWVAEAAREHHHHVELLDLCFEKDPLETVAGRLTERKWDVIGVGLRNLHDNAYRSQEALISEYRKLMFTIRENSSAHVVLGGAGFSLRPRELMARLNADYGVVGEGEKVFPWLLDQIRNKRPVQKIIDRSVISSSGLPVFDEIESLTPPLRSLVDDRYYIFEGTVNIQTKRGCPFQCAYCDYPDLEGRTTRLRGLVHLEEELADVMDDPRTACLFFVDSVFNVPEKYALKVCGLLANAKRQVPWVAYVSPVGLSESLVSLMAESCCAGVEIGSDSGTEEGLVRLRKPFSLSQVERAHELLRRYNIPDCHTFVLGAFGETAREVKKTLDFVDRLDPSVAVFVVFHEDREDQNTAHAQHRLEILALLEEEAKRHPGWVVPELGMRLNPKLANVLRRHHFRGPPWVHLAMRRTYVSPSQTENFDGQLSRKKDVSANTAYARGGNSRPHTYDRKPQGDQHDDT